MPYNRQIPDAPIALSMLPRAAAADLKNNDLLYLVKPGNNLGERCKSLELGGLFDSEVFRLEGFRNSVIKSNILTFSGSLAGTSTGNYTEVAHVDIDPRMDVEFHVWGTSNAASDGSEYNEYAYGLRARVRMLYLPDDTDRDLVALTSAGFRNSDGTGPSSPAYNAVFGCTPYNYTFSPTELANYPTKKVTLYLSTGLIPSAYHGVDPTSFSLNIQATIFPSKYVAGTLLEPASP